METKKNKLSKIMIRFCLFVIFVLFCVSGVNGAIPEPNVDDNISLNINNISLNNSQNNYFNTNNLNLSLYVNDNNTYNITTEISNITYNNVLYEENQKLKSYDDDPIGENYIEFSNNNWNDYSSIHYYENTLTKYWIINSSKKINKINSSILSAMTVDSYQKNYSNTTHKILNNEIYFIFNGSLKKTSLGLNQCNFFYNTSLMYLTYEGWEPIKNFIINYNTHCLFGEKWIHTRLYENSIDIYYLEYQQNISLVNNTHTLNISINGTVFNYTIVIDTTTPSLNISSIEKNNFNDYNISNSINYSDTNYKNCSVEWFNGSIIGCVDNVSFTTSGNYTFNVTVFDYAENYNTSSGYIYINPYQYFRFNETFNSSYITNYTFGDYSSNETYISIPYDELNEGYNELEFRKIGYVPTTYNFTTTNSTQLNITYNTTYIRLYLNIYDRDTESLIAQSVDIDLIGDDFAGEFSTSNGTITIHNISFLPDDYILTFGSEGYSDNTYLFTYTGYNEMNYSIYLQNSTPTTEVRVVVRDLFYNNLENCNVKVKQYFLSSNNYIMVDSGTTNSNGEVLFNLDTEKTFQFVTTCEGETQTETGQKIITTPVYIYFGGDNELTLFDEIPSMSYNLTWINTSENNGYFRYEYNDQNSVISQGCLYIYEITGIEEILINSSCVATTSATININLNMENNTQYVSKGYVTYNSNDRLVDTYTISNYVTNDVFMTGLDLLISVAIVMIFTLLGVALHPYASVLFGIFGLFVMSLLGFFQIAQSFIIGLLVIVIGVILWRYRR